MEDEQDEKDAKDSGYFIHNIANIEIVYKGSCSLRFIDNWKLTDTYIEQLEEAKFDYET